MSNANRFQALRLWAEKEMKFQQGRNMDYLDPGAPRGGTLMAGDVVNQVNWSGAQFGKIENGICAALVADWLKEKVLGTNSIWRRAPKAFRAGSTDAVNAQRVVKLMRGAAPRQIGYAEDGKLGAVARMYRALGLELDDAAMQRDVIELPNPFGGPRHKTTEINLERSFTALCEGGLANGTGLLMEITLSRADNGQRIGGHAIGAYKSDAGRVYFFDPNVGIYKVHGYAGFIVAWRNAYLQLNHKPTMDGRGDGFSTCSPA